MHLAKETAGTPIGYLERVASKTRRFKIGSRIFRRATGQIFRMHEEKPTFIQFSVRRDGVVESWRPNPEQVAANSKQPC